VMGSGSVRTGANPCGLKAPPCILLQRLKERKLVQRVLAYAAGTFTGLQLRAVPGMLLILIFLPWYSLHGQDRMSWKSLTTVGYGGFGCGAGYLLAKEAAREAFDRGNRGSVAAIGAIGGCLAGGRIGRTLGREVDAKLALGEELPTGMRRGVQLGTVLTGATAGTLLSLLVAMSRDDGKTGLVVGGALIGAAAGFVAQLSLNEQLRPAGSPPSLTLGIGPAGGLSVAAVYRF